MFCGGIGSTTSKWRLCNLSSTGKFGRGEAEDEPHNFRVDVVDPASTTDITWQVKLVAGSGC